MATTNSANRVRLAYRIGDTGPFQVVNFTSDSFTATPETKQSEAISSNRKAGGQKVTQITVSGSIDVEMAPLVFDDFLAAALASDWQTDTPTAGTDQLSVGVADKRFQIVKSYLDVDKHVLFSNCAVNSMSLNMNAGEKVTASMEMVGEEVDPEFQASGETFDPAPSALFFDASNNISSLTIDGSPVAGCITEMGLTVENGYDGGNGCVGEQTKRQTIGQSAVTTSKTLRMTADAFDMWKSTLENAEFGSSFTMGDGTTSYTFSIGREFMSSELPGGETSGVLTMAFESTAAVDSAGETLIIERTSA
ncbi:phage tail tube protein [Halomonas alimentaria]|uniref:Uncharacterized protein n=1 Tax=Halomonas alimentaria TaxID=147248 RepID=A0A7X5AR05_9GAMM|nr:phage tail tube protein [Halomonas alimentaria]NAW34997.1 hypothetical protein [Halomonas alimentaria]